MIAGQPGTGKTAIAMGTLSSLCISDKYPAVCRYGTGTGSGHTVYCYCWLRDILS